MRNFSDPPVEPADNPIPPDWPDQRWSEFHAVNGVTWHVQRSGAASRTLPTLLLLHGTAGSTHCWAGVTPALAPHYQVVSIDLPGHGFTRVPVAVERTGAPYTIDGMARMIGDLLRGLGIVPHTVVGHSAGVPVLLRMALDGSVAPARIVGVCPAIVAPPAWYVAFIAPLLGLVLERGVVAHSAARLAHDTRLIERLLGSTGSPLTATQLARYRTLCSRHEHVHAAITMMSRWDLPALFRDVGVLRTPVQLIAGRQDRWIPLAALRRAVERLPGASLTVEEGGHLLPEERPEAVVRSLLPAACDGSRARGRG